MKLLLERGADPMKVSSFALRPLHYAAGHASSIAARVLLATGRVDIEARSESGETALHSASRDKSREVARILLDAGADVNALDNHGSTPLAIAREEGYPAVAALLRRRGGHE